MDCRDPDYERRTVLNGNANDSAFGYTGHFVQSATALHLADRFTMQMERFRGEHSKNFKNDDGCVKTITRA